MAHIPDGFLSAPVLAGTAAVSASALALAARRSRSSLREREAPLLGAMTAFVFAAQMFNFPLGAGTSAHLLGGVLVAVIAGPWAGMLALFSVILVQALLFQDGGIAALGANTLNMAVLGAGGGYLLYRWLFAALGGGSRRRVAAASAAAFVSALLTGTGVAVELALSGLVTARAAFYAVVLPHVLVGVGEAVITGGILAFVMRARPELLAGRDVPTRAGRRWAIGVAGAAVAVAVAAAYGASSRPDVVQAAAARLGLREGTGFVAPFTGYASPTGAWLAAAVGVAAVFLLALALFRTGVRRGA